MAMNVLIHVIKRLAGSSLQSNLQALTVKSVAASILRQCEGYWNGRRCLPHTLTGCATRLLIRTVPLHICHGIERSSCTRGRKVKHTHTATLLHTAAIYW